MSETIVKNQTPKKHKSLKCKLKSLQAGYIGTLILISYYIYMSQIGGDGVIFGSVVGVLGLLGGLELQKLKELL